jgi:hypothetical protein
MGEKLLSCFKKMDDAAISLGEARMQLKLGMTRSRAASLDDTPELVAKAERVLKELIQTKDLFKSRRCNNGIIVSSCP